MSNAIYVWLVFRENGRISFFLTRELAEIYVRDTARPLPIHRGSITLIPE